MVVLNLATELVLYGCQNDSKMSFPLRNTKKLEDSQKCLAISDFLSFVEGI